MVCSIGKWQCWVSISEFQCLKCVYSGKHGHSLQTGVWMANLQTLQATTAAELTVEGTSKKWWRGKKLLLTTLAILLWCNLCLCRWTRATWAFRHGIPTWMAFHCTFPHQRYFFPWDTKTVERGIHFWTLVFNVHIHIWMMINNTCKFILKR